MKNKIRTIMLSIAVAIGLAGCTIPWKTTTVWNVGIHGDKENAERTCVGTLEISTVNGQYICNHGEGNRWTPAIPGDLEHALSECSGIVILDGAYYRCVTRP